MQGASRIRLDEIDIRLLSVLQREGRISKTDLADRINLSVSACFERMQKLEQAKLIQSYHAVVNPAIFGNLQMFHAHIILKTHRAVDFGMFENYVRQISMITECYALGGGVDYSIKVFASTVSQYQRLIDDMLDANLGVDRYFTYIVTKVIKVRDLTVTELQDIRRDGDNDLLAG
ncbi:Lrp/AsnC family transcriptional regulator [Devosia sediminis]|uniref:Lrp/AsnC family transcriptional regulator n=1 Tax=Devosia sediminis TaxID=2798801 RepID=A0A934IYF5_9HYPH|nr:Lrp/AsnC family transcriptional regulator [Devosia sediminis]MBJ3785380.1 Lrp/AsnC family transcriptional regulator [Devosia sediminis]